MRLPTLTGAHIKRNPLYYTNGKNDSTISRRRLRKLFLNSLLERSKYICGDGINVSQASESRYIRDVSRGLQAIYHQFVSMPTGLKRVEVKNNFYGIAHFPGFEKLSRLHKSAFYHSINVQAVC